MDYNVNLVKLYVKCVFFKELNQYNVISVKYPKQSSRL